MTGHPILQVQVCQSTSLQAEADTVLGLPPDALMNYNSYASDIKTIKLPSADQSRFSNAEVIPAFATTNF